MSLLSKAANWWYYDVGQPIAASMWSPVIRTTLPLMIEIQQFPGSKPGLIETAQGHRESANEMIPTFGKIDEWKEEHRDYIITQSIQEFAAPILGINLWLPIKIALEARDVYEEFY